MSHFAVVAVIIHIAARSNAISANCFPAHDLWFCTVLGGYLPITASKLPPGATTERYP